MSVTAENLHIGLIQHYSAKELKQLGLAKEVTVALRTQIHQWGSMDKKVMDIFEEFLGKSDESREIFKSFMAELLSSDDAPKVKFVFRQWWGAGENTDYAVTEHCYVTQKCALSLDHDAVSPERREQQLRRLAEVGSKKYTRILLEKGVNPNARDSKGITALHRACQWSFLDVAKILHKAGAVVGIRDYLGQTGLHHGHYDADLIDWLVEEGVDPSTEDYTRCSKLIRLVNDPDTHQRMDEICEELMRPHKSGVTPLFRAASSGETEACKRLVHHGADLEATCTLNGWAKVTPLAAAIMNGELEAAQVLIDAGAAKDIRLPVNKYDYNSKLIKNKYANISLMGLAAYMGHRDAMEFLLKNGLTVNEEGCYSPLYWAVIGGQEDSLCWLLAHEADPNAKGPIGKTPLQATIEENKPELAKLLLLKDADPNTTDYQGTSLLKLALKSSACGIALHLLKHGADPDLDASKGVFHLAAKAGRQDIMEVLADLGVDLDGYGPPTQDYSDIVMRTPLHVAAMAGKLDLVKFLIGLGADPFKRVQRGWSESSLSDRESVIELAKDPEVKAYLRNLIMECVLSGEVKVKK